MAQALVAGFRRVTVIERDRLPVGPGNRRGVPQDRHLHLLLPAGIEALEQLFEGLVEQLADAGAVVAETDRIRMCLNGHQLVPARSGQRALFASRPFVEAHVRRRVRDEPRITVREHAAVAGLVLSHDRRRVEGVQLAVAEGGVAEALSADLVVDCSGRRTPLPGWLDELGYRAAEVEELDVQVQYATRRYELPEGVLDGDHHVLIGPTRDGPRGGAMTNVEDGSWLVTLFAMGGERAPTDVRSFTSFAARLPSNDIHAAITSGRALDEPAPYRFPANRRHHYERLDELPAGLLAAGDSVCSFNPIYGQGMSIAAIEARALQARLLDGSCPSVRTWFRQVARTVDTAWQLAVGADLAVAAIPGRRPLSVRMFNRYLHRLQAAAVVEPALTARLIRVVGLVDPPARLLHPSAVWSVLRRIRSAGGPGRV